MSEHITRLLMAVKHDADNCTSCEGSGYLWSPSGPYSADKEPCEECSELRLILFKGREYIPEDEPERFDETEPIEKW